MQLILTHADLEAALINDLRSKGMTAFEPGKASVEFSFKRGTKELVCTLDTEPKAEVEAPAVDPKPVTASSATQTATTSAPVAKAQADAPAEAASEPAQTAEAEAPATTTAEVEAPAGSADDNLFD